MAKLLKMPSLSIIAGLKGTIDFYYWKGIPCARKWPNSPGSNRAPGVQAAWAPFTWAAKNWAGLGKEIKEAYNQMAVGTNMTGRDIFMKTFITPAFFTLE